MLDVPLLVSFGTSSADGGLACHSHCFSEDSEAVAHFQTGWLSRASQPRSSSSLLHGFVEERFG